MTPRLLTTKDVAAVLRLSEGSLRNLRYRGRGPRYLKLPTGAVRYEHVDVTAWTHGEGR